MSLKLFNKKKSATLNSQTLMSLISIFILDAIVYVTNPIFVNLLSPAAYGTVSLYSSYREILMVVFGLQTLGSISYAAVHFKDGDYNKYCSCALTISSISFVVFSAITIVLMGQVSNLLDIPQVLIPFLVVQSFGNYIVSFNSYRLIYQKKAGQSMLISGAISLTSTALSIVLVLILRNNNGYDGYWGRIIGVFAPNVLAGLILLVLQFVRARPNFSREFVKVCLIVSIPMIFHRLGQIFLSKTDIFMIDALANGDADYKKAQVAYYSYAASMASVVGVIFNAFNNSWVAFLFDDYKKGDFEAIKKRSINYINIFTALVFGFLMICPEIIKWFAPGDYHIGVYIMPILVFSSYLVFLYSFFVNIEIYHAKTIYIMFGTIAAAIINIGLNYLFIMNFGIVGAAIATAISYVCLFCFHLLLCKLKYKHFCYFSSYTFIIDFLIICFGVLLSLAYADSMRARWPFGFIALFYIAISTYKRKSIF